jgi:hypothetical protein
VHREPAVIVSNTAVRGVNRRVKGFLHSTILHAFLDWEKISKTILENVFFYIF